MSNITPRSLTIDYHGSPFDMVEGIHFGMDENLYHSLPALSSTGFKNLLISAPDFYFNSWLNPFREEDAEDNELKEWSIFGKAAHVRVLEGSVMFYSRYCVEFIPPEGCLKTTDDMKRYLTETGMDMKGKSSWKKPEWVQAVKFQNPNALIYDMEEEKYFRETGGKIQLTEKQIRRIEIAAAMIEKHPELKGCFKGGYAEVTIIWFDDGIWYKARIDFLKPETIVDFKTFTNDTKNMPIDRALYLKMASHKYHIQVCHYNKAVKFAVDFVKRGLITYTAQGIFNDPPERFKAFLEQFASYAGLRNFYFVFQKKGGAPLARGKKFKSNSLMFGAGEASIAEATEAYKHYLALYGTEIWVDDSSITEFEDDQFPAYATEV